MIPNLPWVFVHASFILIDLVTFVSQMKSLVSKSRVWIIGSFQKNSYNCYFKKYNDFAFTNYFLGHFALSKFYVFSLELSTNERRTHVLIFSVFFHFPVLSTWLTLQQSYSPCPEQCLSPESKQKRSTSHLLSSWFL